MAKEKKVRERVNWNRELKLAPGYLILCLWILFTVVLLGWVVGASFSTTKAIFSGKIMSSGFHLENYAKAWNNSNVSTFFMNSLGYSIISCTLLILICAPAAYVLSRFKFISNKVIQTGFVSAMGVPVVMIVLPLFGLVAGMDLLTFFANISRAFEEAAAIDGCSPTKTFWLIMLPMAQPGIITVTIFNFINVWNEYFISLIFGNSDRIRPVAVGLYSMINSMKYTGDWAGMFAAVIIVFLPTFILYIFLSEKIIAGVTGGGVKG